MTKYRRVLKEAAKSIDDLDKYWINVTGDNDKYHVGLMQPGEGIWAEYGDEIGFVAVRRLDSSMGKGAQDCFETYNTEAPSGWGPLLYDIAMEIAVLLDGVLVSDRNKISQDARSLWSYYKNQRSDVQAHQMDDASARIVTPDDDSDDIINPPPWNDHKRIEREIDQNKDELISKFKKDPQTSSYTKSVTIIPNLKNLKKFESTLSLL